MGSVCVCVCADAGDVKLLKYHCDACHCNFTSSVRINCAECRNWDLCVECFARGVERGEHKSNHKYYVLVRLTDRQTDRLTDRQHHARGRQRRKAISTSTGDWNCVCCAVLSVASFMQEPLAHTRILYHTNF